MLESDRHCTVHIKILKKTRKPKPKNPQTKPNYGKTFRPLKHPPSTKSKSEGNVCLPVPWLLPARMATTRCKLSSNGCEPEPAGPQSKPLPAFSPLGAIQFSPKPTGSPPRLQQTLDQPHRLTAGAGPCFTVIAFLSSQKSHPLKFLKGFSIFPSMHAFNIHYG